MQKVLFTIFIIIKVLEQNMLIICKKVVHTYININYVNKNKNVRAGMLAN